MDLCCENSSKNRCYAEKETAFAHKRYDLLSEETANHYCTVRLRFCSRLNYEEVEEEEHASRGGLGKTGCLFSGSQGRFGVGVASTE
jgi:hypothetical protein